MQSRRVGRGLGLPHGSPGSVVLRRKYSSLGQTSVKFGHHLGHQLSQRTDGVGGAVIGFKGRGPPFPLPSQLAIPQAR